MVNNRDMQKIRGFTLIELSIVLVIIGLIVGGVVGGASLVKSARLQKEITTIKEYKTAINAFRSLYDELPGDMPDADEYWSECVDSSAGSCSGNGDNFISGDSYVRGNPIGRPYQMGPRIVQVQSEARRVWEHLHLADIIPQYLNASTSTVSDEVFPASEIFANHYFNVQYIDPLYNRPAHYITVMGESSRSALDVIQMISIDKKIDDGKASSGNYLGWYANETQCVDGRRDDADVQYVITSEQVGCFGSYNLGS